MRKLLTVFAAVLLALGGVFAPSASATAQAVCSGAGSCWFTWGRITAGDCTMDQAKWTLNRNGTAYFEAIIVSSDTNDAWLMWADTVDSGGVVLGSVAHGIDPKFSRGTVKNQRIWWFDSGTFDSRVFDRINGMRLRSHC